MIPSIISNQLMWGKSSKKTFVCVDLTRALAHIKTFISKTPTRPEPETRSGQ